MLRQWRKAIVLTAGIIGGGVLVKAGDVAVVEPGPIAGFAVEQWRAAGAGLATLNPGESGPIFMEQLARADRYYGVHQLPVENMAGEGFKDGGGRGGRVWMAAVKDEAEPASLSWTNDGGNMSGRVFVAIADIWGEGYAGKEAIAIYHNDALVGRFVLGDRMDKPYSFPYCWTRADRRGDVGMELSFEAGNRLPRHGFTLPSRRMFQKNDTLRLVAETPGFYAISHVFLVPRDDTMAAWQLAIGNLEHRFWRHGAHDGKLQLAWTTTVPSRCGVLYAADAAALARGHGQWSGLGENYAENHQFFIPHEMLPDDGGRMFFRILAESNDGDRSVSEISEAAPPPRVAQQASGRLPLAAAERQPIPVAGPAFATVPFAPGVLMEPARVAVRDTVSGRQVVAQGEVLGVHDDHSVSWLEVSFAAGPEGQYELVWGPDVAAPESGLRITHAGEVVTVADEAVEAVFSPTAGGGLSRVVLRDGAREWAMAPDEVMLYMTGTDGRIFAAAPPRDLTIESSGAAAVTIKALGHFTAADGEPLFEYIARWTLHHGMAAVSLELTFGNDRPDIAQKMYESLKEITHFRNLYLAVPAPAAVAAPATAFLADGTALPLAATAGAFHQRDENHYRHGPGEAMQDAAGRLAGRLRVGDAVVAVEKFWQQYPKSLELSNGRIAIGLMPDFRVEDYPEEPYETYTRLFFYTKNGEYRIMTGVQKTHRLLFGLGEQVAAFANAQPILSQRYVFAPPTAYLCRHAGFGPLRPADDRYRVFDEWMGRGLDLILAARDKEREYGVLNFGDWWGERNSNWGNLEYDLGQSFALEYMRRAQGEWLETAWEMANHQADVDTVHYGRNAGLQVMHAMAHTGREYFHADGETWHSIRDRTGKDRPGYNQCFHAGHMWIGGISQVGMLAASRRLLEVAELFGQNRARGVTRLLQPGHHRGLNLIAFTNLAQIANDPFYLNAARITIDRYRTMIDPVSGGVYAEHYAQNTIDAQHRKGLLYFAAVRPGDQTVEQLLLTSMRAIDLSLWDEEVQGIVTSHHAWWPNRREDITWSLLFAKTAVLTGEPRWRDRLMINLQDGLTRHHPTSKVVGSGMQFNSFLPAMLDAAGIEDIAAQEAPPEVLKARSLGGRGGISAKPSPAGAAAPSPPEPFRITSWDDATILAHAVHPFVMRSSHLDKGPTPFPSQRVVSATGEVRETGFMVADANGKPRRFTAGRYRLDGAAWSGSSRNDGNWSGISLGLFSEAKPGIADLRVAPENPNLLVGAYLGNRQHLSAKSVSDPAHGDHLTLVWRDQADEVQSLTWPIKTDAPLALPFPLYGDRDQAGPIRLEIEISELAVVARVIDRRQEPPTVLLQTPPQTLPFETGGFVGVALRAEAVPKQTVSTAVGSLEVTP